MSPKTLIAARGKHLTIHDRVRGSRTVPVFDPDELLAFKIAYHDRRDIRSVGYQLGLPDRGVEQLAMTSRSRRPLESGDAFDTAILPANAPSLLGETFHFVAADVTKLETALTEARTLATLENSIPLIRAVYAVRGGTKPWGALIAALLDGTLPFDITDDTEAPLIHRILISRSGLHFVATLRTSASFGPRLRPAMTREEALSTLNAGAQDDCLDGLPRVGCNPIAFDVAKVEERSRHAIAIAEIAWRTGTSPNSVFKWLKDVKAPLLHKRMWDRDFVEQRIAELGDDLLTF